MLAITIFLFVRLKISEKQLSTAMQNLERHYSHLQDCWVPNRRFASSAEQYLPTLCSLAECLYTERPEPCCRTHALRQRANPNRKEIVRKMVRLVGLEPTTGKTPVDFKPTAYANFATAAPATRHPENITRRNHPHSCRSSGMNFPQNKNKPGFSMKIG
jgi:hypothetical protein